MRQDQGHHEPGTVVQERGHVDPLVPPQQKREQIRLPELVRLRALKPPRGRPGLRPRQGRRRAQALRVQDPPHRALRHAQGVKPLEDVPDPPGPDLRVRPPDRHHGLPSRLGPRRGNRERRRHREQPVHPACPIPTHPQDRRVRADPAGPRHRRQSQPLLDHRPGHPQSDFQGPRRSGGPPAGRSRPPGACRCLARHLSPPCGPPCPARRGTGAKGLSGRPKGHPLVRGAGTRARVSRRWGRLGSATCRIGGRPPWRPHGHCAERRVER